MFDVKVALFSMESHLFVISPLINDCIMFNQLINQSVNQSISVGILMISYDHLIFINRNPYT